MKLSQKNQKFQEFLRSGSTTQPSVYEVKINYFNQSETIHAHLQ